MYIFDDFSGAGGKPKHGNLKDWRPLLHKDQNGKCRYCGVKLREGDGHVDYGRPFSRGGKATPKNMQLLCGPCNTRKGALTDGEFRKRFKSVLPDTLPPSKPIPLAKFKAVAKDISIRKAKAAKKRREEDPWVVSFP